MRAGGAQQGVNGTEMSGASVSMSKAPGGAASAPGSSGTMSSELPEPICLVLLTLCPRPSSGGRWRAK
jgi:hypothetical protein